MLSRSQRLSSAQFERAFANSQSVRHPLVALKAHRRGDSCEAVRAAFVVPKKQSKAVGRNRTRRRLRERYRLHPRRDDLLGCDLIFLSTPATHAATPADLDAALDEVLRRMKRKLDAGSDSTGAGLPPNSNRRSSSTARRLEEGGNPAPVEPNASAMTAVAPAELALTEQAQINPTHSIFARAALSIIGFYQRFISPGLPPSCRFYPSCSRYTYGAIERFGFARGLWLGAHRVCRCHPWNAGGLDEVPDRFPSARQGKARSIQKLKDFFARRRFDSPRN